MVYTNGEVTVAEREDGPAAVKETDEALPFWTQGDEIAKLLYQKLIK